MSTNVPESPARPESPAPFFLAYAVRSWNRFWFTPADPTLLGLIRLCTGLLAVYTIFTYTWDLQAFFGRDAWMNHELREASRHETPLILDPLHWPQTQASDLLASLH